MPVAFTFPLSRYTASLLLAAAIWASGLAAHAWFTGGACADELLWPPAGLAVGALLCCSRRSWPAVVGGLVLLELTHQSTLAAVPAAVATGLLEAAFAVAAMRWLRLDRGFGGVRDVIVFLGGAVIAGPLVAKAVVSAVLWVFMGEPLDWMASAVSTVSHMAGVGAVAPVFLVFQLEWWRALSRLGRVLCVLLILLGPLLIVTELGVWRLEVAGGSPFILLSLPLAAVLVIGFSLVPATVVVLLMELTLVGATAAGVGPFRQASAWQSLVAMGGFMALLSGMTLLLGGIKRQRQRAETLALAAMNSARVAQWTWREGEGLVLRDPEWAGYFGVQPGEAASPERVNAAVHPGDRFSLRLWCGGLEPLPPSQVEEFRLHGPAGEWRWVTSRRLPQPRGFQGEPGVVYGVFQDVTERKEAEQLHIEAERRDAELRNLKLSIHPHFLFNSLNSLRSLIASRPAEAREFVTQLASFLHAAVSEVDQDLMPLARSLAVTGLYLGIERTRFGERLRVSVQTTDEARAAAFPPLLLQTLVENALKYGVAPHPKGGEIRIEAEVKEGRLHVRVSNEGRIAPSPATATGTGLRSADRRVKLLFGDAASVRLSEDATPRVTAEVVVPVRPPPDTGFSAMDPSTPAAQPYP